MKDTTYPWEIRETLAGGLLPCPFCGAKSNWIQNLPPVGLYLHQWQVWCKVCQVHGPAKNDKLSAIAAWNTRQYVPLSRSPSYDELYSVLREWPLGHPGRDKAMALCAEIVEKWHG